MNDLIIGAKVHGTLLYHGTDLYGSKVDPVEVRRRIGMVFQKPNPFPKSIFDNIAFGPRLNGRKRGLDDIVEDALTRAALWDEVKDKLKDSALRAVGWPAAAPVHRAVHRRAARRDPHGRAVLGARPDRHRQDRGPHGRSSSADFTIVIVTHNMQQAARVSRSHRVLHRPTSHEGGRIGHLVEFDVTEKLFTAPSDPRTEGYITGRFG